MCLNPSPFPSVPSTQIRASRPCKLSSKRHHVRVPGLNRRRESRKGHEVEKIEMKNLKLYMKNQRIREENEKLRRKALALYQEKQNLLAQLQSKLYTCSPQTTS